MDLCFNMYLLALSRQILDIKQHFTMYVLTSHFIMFLYTKVLDNLLCWALGCAVLIAETMLDGQRPYSALQSLNMLTQTEGIERTERQYADVLSKQGFGNIRVVNTMNFLDALIAIKM